MLNDALFLFVSHARISSIPQINFRKGDIDLQDVSLSKSVFSLVGYEVIVL